jgi:hypothetical protein
LEPLRAAHKDFVEQHLASLRERMEAAEKLAASDRSRAATLYRALIDLHQQDAWAAEIVAEARGRLELIQTPE